MIRFSSLFLALNILFCYVGLYRDAFAISSAPRAKTSSGCHGISHQSLETGEEIPARLTNYSVCPDHPCCMEVLTNSSPYLNPQIEVLVTDRTQRCIIIQDRQYLDQLRNNSFRDHDPPELQITNSIFLL